MINDESINIVKIQGDPKMCKILKKQKKNSIVFQWKIQRENWYCQICVILKDKF